MASFTAFFYELFFGSNWDKPYCDPPSKTEANAVLPAVETTSEAVLPLVSKAFKRRKLGTH
jgi:hypothetical protein